MVCESQVGKLRMRGVLVEDIELAKKDPKAILAKANLKKGDKDYCDCKQCKYYRSRLKNIATGRDSILKKHIMGMV